MTKVDIVNANIQNRKSVYPKFYIDKVIDKSIIEQLLLNAHRAPTHKLTQPWRFQVFRKSQKQVLADEMARLYKLNTASEKFNEAKYLKTKTKPLKADSIIAIIMHRDEKEQIPSWEEIASVSMAVQNMYLTAAAYDLGCYWSSPSYIHLMQDFLSLKPNEHCLGFFYLGHYDTTINLPLSRRDTIENFIEWKE